MDKKTNLLEKIKKGEVLTSADLNSIDGIEFDGLESLTEFIEEAGIEELTEFLKSYGIKFDK